MAKKPTRQITESIRGKHIGHAVEGHCRGIIRRLAQELNCSVERTLPFAFPVDTDVILLDHKGRVRSLAIVAYNHESRDTVRRLDHSSHKFYRTRLEYNEILRAYNEDPKKFAPDFCPLVMIYGSVSSWKPKLLEELSQQCPPTCFLPQVIGQEQTNKVIADCLDIYEVSWTKSGKAAREVVEEHYASIRKLPQVHNVVASVINKHLTSDISKAAFAARTPLPQSQSTQSSIPQPFHSRYRQAISLASLFPNTELKSWQNYTAGKDIDGDVDEFCRRGKFLDLVTIQLRQTIRGSILFPQLRRPLDNSGIYQPHRPDFSEWASMEWKTLKKILGTHRELPIQSKSFRAGGIDQAAGNWRAFCYSAVNRIPEISKAMKSGQVRKLANLLREDDIISAEDWNTSASSAGFLAMWSLCVSAASTCLNARSEFRRHTFRRTVVSDSESKLLAQSLVNNRDLGISLLDPALLFCKSLLDSDLSHLASFDQPMLFSLGNPSSWVSAMYLSITTNPSHNPLAIPSRKWLEAEWPNISWSGFPVARGARIGSLVGSPNFRLEWTFAGINPSEKRKTKKGTLVAAECRSITANNFGNKSKELYDRIGQTRQCAKKAGYDVELIGILDGDFSLDIINELTSAIGYDRIIPIQNVLNVSFD